MADIIVDNLTKTYGHGENEIRALDKVSFSLGGGEFCVVLGPSGSGKSTLLNILGGMDTASVGQVTVADKEITALTEKELTRYRREDIGFVFQFYNLMPNLTALENVRLCENTNDGGAEKALELVGLNKRQRNFPAQLSGGEQQRVSIARALVKNPKLLLCDEPTGALDSKTGRNIIMLLQRLAKEDGRNVIIVTHNAKLSLAADRVIRLNDGKIIENTVQSVPLDAGEIEF